MIKRFICLLTAMLLLAASAMAASPAAEYDDACELLMRGNFAGAAEAFNALGFYGDASLMALYCAALDAGADGNYATAALNFEALGSFRDAPLYARYYTALWYESGEEYEEAADILAGMTLFLDASERLAGYPALIIARDAAALEARNADAYAEAVAAETLGQLERALTGFLSLGSYLDSAERAAAVHVRITERDAATAEAALTDAYAAADRAEQDGDYAAAFTGFTTLGDYRDSVARAAAVELKGKYAMGMQYAMAGRFSDAYEVFTALGDYEDSAEKAYVLGVTTFAHLSDLGNGVAAFTFHDMVGIINVPENIALTPQWDRIYSFNSLGLAKVTLKGLSGYIDRKGNVIIPSEWYDVSSFIGNLCMVARRLDNNTTHFGLFDAHGNQISPAQWLNLGSSTGARYSYDLNAPVFSDGLIPVMNTDKKWGYIDQQGNIRIEPQYDAALAFSEGLAAVKSGKYWLFIDTENNVVISGKYTEASSFHQGMADVYREGAGWQVINKDGTLLYFISSDMIDQYNTAVALMESGEYFAAREYFVKLANYSDSAQKVEECTRLQNEADYLAAVALMESGEYLAAREYFVKLANYSDSAQKVEECTRLQNEADYLAAIALMESGEYADAYSLLRKLPGYRDVDELIGVCQSNLGPGYIVSSDGKYGFVLNEDGFYESDNKGVHNSYALCEVTFRTTTGYIYIDYIQHAQSRKDFGLISVLDAALSPSTSVDKDFVLLNLSTINKPSVQTLRIEVPDSEYHTITLKFIKDGSGSQFKDSLQFRIRFE